MTFFFFLTCTNYFYSLIITRVIQDRGKKNFYITLIQNLNILDNNLSIIIILSTHNQFFFEIF